MPMYDAAGAKAPESTPSSRPYFLELDGVRAIAALMVMAFHYSQSMRPSRLMMLGQTGVDLFFVLSGFLITLILLEAKHGDWGEMRRFYIRRTLRIFPLYYGYLLISLAAGSAVSIWYWFYTQNIAFSLRIPLNGSYHLWSLAVEEQFYLVWPLLILFVPRRRLPIMLWGTILLAIGSRIVLAHTRIDGTELTICRMDALAAGGLLAYYYGKGVIQRAHHAFRIGVVVGIVSMGVEWWITHGNGVAWVQTVKYCSTELLYASIIGLVIGSSGTLAHRFLRCTPMRALGRVSYGMYVIHPTLFGWLPQHLGNMPFFAKAGISFVAVYLVAVVSFYGFERRLSGLKDRFAPNTPFVPTTGPVIAPGFVPLPIHALADPTPLRMMERA